VIEPTSGMDVNAKGALCIDVVKAHADVKNPQSKIGEPPLALSSNILAGV